MPESSVPNLIVTSSPKEDASYSQVEDYFSRFSSEGPKICSALVAKSGYLDAKGESGIPVPWITMVLGSEVLDSLPDKPNKDCFLSNLRTQLAEIKNARYPVSEELDEITEFAWNLLKSRDSFKLTNSESEKNDQLDERSPRYDYVQRAVLIAAYSITKAYFFSKTVRSIPINRAADQLLDLTQMGFSWPDSNEDPRTPEVVFFERAAASLEDLIGAISRVNKPRIPDAGSSDVTQEHENKMRGVRSDQLPTLKSLAEMMQREISKTYDTANVSSGSLLLLTEIARHYLVDTLRHPEAPDVYPDWAEQLIAIDIQAADDNTSKNDDRYYDARLTGIEPLGVTYKQIRNAIERDLEQLTVSRSNQLQEASNQPGGDLKDHDRAYRTYTEVLGAQAAICKEAKHLEETLLSGRQQSNTDGTGLGGDNNVPDWLKQEEYLDEQLNIDQSNDIDNQASSSLGAEAVPSEDEGDRLNDMDSQTFTSLKDEAPASEDGSDSVSMNNPPYAVAVVTTFDIELELAMWHFYQNDFMVILPVNVIFGEVVRDERDCDVLEKGQQAWIGYIVHPTKASTGQDAVNMIRRPGKQAFFLIQSRQEETNAISSKIVRNVLYDSTMPIIVKLCGSPLVQLPVDKNDIFDWDPNDGSDTLTLARDFEKSKFELFDMLYGEKGDKIKAARGNLKLRHGLIIEDYQAMAAVLPEADTSERFALPADLRGAQSRGYWRYWTLLGVNIANSALRYRLVGQMLGSSFGPGAPNRQKALGIAISRRQSVNRKARSILRWKEIALIEDDALSFSCYLEHYRKHLEDEEGRSRPLSGKNEERSLDAVGHAQNIQVDPVSRLTWTYCKIEDEGTGR